MARGDFSGQRSPGRGGARSSGGRDSLKQTSRPARPSAQAELLIEPRPDWHGIELPIIVAPSKTLPVPTVLIDAFQTHAKKLLEDEASKYAESHLKASSSYKFMSTIMSSGTWSDKVSALTLVVQESPIHTLKPLENLIGLAGKRSRDQALMAISAVKDLFGQGNVLPSDRKLKLFSKQPGLLGPLQDLKPTYIPTGKLPNGLTPQHLMLWAFEDRLKSLYFDMLRVLEGWCNDEVEFARTRAVTSVFEMLRDKPEQEENLLRLLVNKLGDTSKKVASRASYLLLQLQSTHPTMKSIIIGAVESDILLRPGQSLNAKYYAVITLNQTVLQTSDPDTANKLLDVYFSLFITILNRQQRAREGPSEKDLKSALGNDSKRKLAKAEAEAAVSRSEEELQEKITAQVLTGINRAFPFSKKDSGAFEKHLNTMFRITHSSNFNTSIQALMLIQQISSTHHISTDRFLRTLYQSLLDPRLLKSSKQTMYLNLLYRSLKEDISIRRIKAFVKRLLQILALHEPPFICAALYLIIELRNIFPGLKSMLDNPEHDVSGLSDDEDDAEIIPGKATDLPVPDPISLSSPSRTKSYDGRKRDPEYSNAEMTCLWEIIPWLHHSHPSVTLFANYLMTPTSKAPPKPDPASHTLTHFLDRLAYRKPKTKDSAHLRGTSLMQPGLASSRAADTLLSSVKRHGPSGATLNSEAFWKKRAEEVKEDEVFFHRYFGMANVGRPAKKGKDKLDEDGDLEVEEGGANDEDDFDEDEVWKAIVGSKGGEDVGGKEDEFEDDDDVEIEGYEDSEEEELADVESGSFSEGGVELGEGLNDLSGLLNEGSAIEDEEDTRIDEDEGDFKIEDDSDASALFSSEEDEEEAVVNAKKGKAAGAKRKEMNVDEVTALLAERKRGTVGGKGAKRRKMHLPTFASAEDYAALVGGGGGDDEDEDGR